MQDYSSTTTTGDAGAVGLYLVFAIILYFVFCYILSRVFTKANKPAWAAYVPIYNGWVIFEIGGKPGWWVLAGFIPFIGGIISFVLYIIVSLEIAKRFGKSSVFGIFGLWLFSLIGYIILAFDDSKYQGSNPVAATAKPAAAKTTETSSDDTPASPPLVQ
jgi:hypothetical protein